MKEINELIQAKFNQMCVSGKLFRSSITGQQVWDTYLNSFKEENDPVFRDPNSSEHNCNLCNNFIRRYGNIVSINSNYEIESLFDIEIEPSNEYYDSLKAMSNLLKNSTVSNIFLETYNKLNSLPYESCNKTQAEYKLGVDKNIKRYTKEEAELYGVVKPNEIITFNHFSLTLPTLFVDKTGNSIESIMGEFKSSKDVFLRGLLEIPLDTLELVKDLINQDSLLDGKTHLVKIEAFIKYVKEFQIIPSDKRDNYAWVNSYKMTYSKFRNELIGVLCSDLAQGVELNKACLDWNKRVDPKNYMKANSPITKSQIKEARKFVEKNGYEDSFKRRMATIDDIKASEILHINSGDGKIKEVSVFDTVKPSIPTRHKKSEFNKIQEISIDKFMSDILPTTKSLEILLENRHEGNLVSLTTSDNDESKPIMKWDNNYSWTFNGDLSGKSEIKEVVKSVGGRVDGILRFSIIWNEDGKDLLDFDAHCKTPSTEIYFSNKKDDSTGGWLDVDMIRPNKLGVENITWQNKSKMKEGEYIFFIRNYDRGQNKGFKAEIEIEGEIYNYEYNNRVSRDISVATVTLKDGKFSIEHKLPETTSSKELYGLETNNFQKVELMCLSPNFWGKNNVGNKFYMFMLKNCRPKTSIKGFHNDNLSPELVKHRKVLDVISSQQRVEPIKNGLSGLGFNATVRDSVIVKVGGTHSRIMKLNF